MAEETPTARAQGTFLNAAHIERCASVVPNYALNVAWKVVDQSPEEPEGPEGAREYRLTLRDGSGQEAKIRIRAVEGASLSASDARATIEPHLDRPILPDYLVYGANWPSDLP